MNFSTGLPFSADHRPGKGKSPCLFYGKHLSTAVVVFLSVKKISVFHFAFLLPLMFVHTAIFKKEADCNPSNKEIVGLMCFSVDLCVKLSLKDSPCEAHDDD